LGQKSWFNRKIASTRWTRYRWLTTYVLAGTSHLTR